MSVGIPLGWSSKFREGPDSSPLRFWPFERVMFTPASKALVINHHISLVDKFIGLIIEKPIEYIFELTRDSSKAESVGGSQD